MTDRPMNITIARAETGAPDTDDMVAVHRIFRREFTLLARVIRTSPPVLVPRTEAIAKHLEFILTALHNHHETEDEFLWPLLVERAAPTAEVTERMAAQHAAVAAHLDRASVLLAEWRVDPGRAVAADLAATLEALSKALVEHLDDEEREILPLVRAYVTSAEWTAFGQKSFDKFPRSALPMMLGQVLEEATPRDVKVFLGELPAPIRLFWRLRGRRQYERYIGAIRGVARTRGNRMRSQGNKLGVATYRRSDGKLGGKGAKGLRVLLITVPGRRSGVPHTTPVRYFPHAGGYLVAATDGGRAAEPQWMRNLRAATRAEVQVDAERFPVTVEVLDGPAKDQLWQDVVLTRAPFFADYVRKSGRDIAIALLKKDAG
ncbi:nitroreductase/quinone reductase family protein [Actinokineospora sp. HUAS TT18]|uniref:nitroreductase/quinone reductase family protein n=1 Tax=Actinokineospora sp. HUAS TT18 TaxID=3447451 RepID=UPI003F524B6F